MEEKKPYSDTDKAVLLDNFITNDHIKSRTGIVLQTELLNAFYQNFFKGGKPVIHPHPFVNFEK